MSVFGVFLVRIFQHSGCTQRDKKYLTVFSLNEGKYGPEKLQIRTILTAAHIYTRNCSSQNNNGRICSSNCLHYDLTRYTQKIEGSIEIKDFFGKCDQIRRKLRIWSH